MTLFRDRPALLPAFRGGERTALETVYRHYVADVSRILRLGFVTGSDARLRIPPLCDDAALRDAIQEVFVRAFQERSRTSYDGLRPFRPFLLQIARNLRLDQLRRAGRELPLSSLGEAGESIDIDAVIEQNLAVNHRADHEPQARREWDTLIEQTRRYVASLDGEVQEFVRLRFVQGRAQEDIAQAMGVTRRLVRTLEARVLAGLTRYLNK